MSEATRGGWVSGPAVGKMPADKKGGAAGRGLKHREILGKDSDVLQTFVEQAACQPPTTEMCL